MAVQRLVTKQHSSALTQHDVAPWDSASSANYCTKHDTVKHCSDCAKPPVLCMQAFPPLLWRCMQHVCALHADSLHKFTMFLSTGVTDGVLVHHLVLFEGLQT